ncbi:MAG: hypothetical protein ACRDNF_00630 [Streptosporangiaceae bacterium]
MIKIRYSQLQVGLHATVKTEDGHTVIYLVPGLSTAERRSAVDRLRASGKVGYGPKLPAIPLAAAVIADRVKVTTRNAIAAVRLHPTGVAIPAVVLVSGAILYTLLVTVAVNLGLPVTSDLAVGPLPVAAAPVSNASTTPHRPAPHPAGPGTGSQPGPGSTGSKARRGQPGKSTPDRSANPTPTRTQPSGSSSPTASSSPSAPPSGSPSASPSPSPTSTSPCLNLGLIHLCV